MKLVLKSYVGFDHEVTKFVNEHHILKQNVVTITPNGPNVYGKFLFTMWYWELVE